MMRRLLLMLGAMAAVPAAAADPGHVRIVVIDVEGGAATLYVTPHGRSLLIDAGWPAGMSGSGNSADRIVAAARSQGLSRIDYLVVTHYHVDHVGGAAALIARFPVGTIIDHGGNRELAAPGVAAGPAAPSTLYPAYLTAIAGHPHKVMRAGETLDIDGLKLTTLTSDGTPIARPLSGAGEPGIGCDAAAGNKDVGGEENPRSLGLLLRWGKARVLSLADLTWDAEAGLVCPRDRVGRVDLMLADNHGSGNANNPALIRTVRPRVAIIANGPRKGGDPSTFDTLWSAGAAVWQLHFATRAAARNTVPQQIVNEGGEDGALPLLVDLSSDGSIGVTNERTGKTILYPG